MVPQTAAAVVAFALLVVPGITFELLRQTRRPAFDQTALEEAAHVLVTSIALAAAAAGLLALAGFVIHDLVVDVDVLAHRGASSYWRNHPRTVIRSVVLEVGLATVLALLIHRSLNHPEGIATRIAERAAWVLRHEPGGRVERFAVWRTVFRDWQPKGATTRVTVLKKDGSLVTGELAGYDTTGSRGERDIAIGASREPIEIFRPEWGELRQLPPAWKVLLIGGSDISEIYVTWPPDSTPASDSRRQGDSRAR